MPTPVDVQIPALLVPVLAEHARRKGVRLDDVVQDWLAARAREDRDGPRPIIQA